MATKHESNTIRQNTEEASGPKSWISLIIIACREDLFYKIKRNLNYRQHQADSLEHNATKY